jgi:hypothetical protein
VPPRPVSVYDALLFPENLGDACSATDRRTSLQTAAEWLFELRKTHKQEPLGCRIASHLCPCSPSRAIMIDREQRRCASGRCFCARSRASPRHPSAQAHAQPVRLTRPKNMQGFSMPPSSRELRPTFSNTPKPYMYFLHAYLHRCKDGVILLEIHNLDGNIHR